MNWLTVVLGVVLVLAPFVLGYSGNGGALWTSLAVGVLIAALGLVRRPRLSAVVGLAAFVAPWVIGFSHNTGALWSCLIVGGIVTLVDGYRGFVAHKETSGALRPSPPQPHS